MSSPTSWGLFLASITTSSLIYFIFGCPGSSLLSEGFLQLQQVGATLHCGAWASHCGGFSCHGAQASAVAACGLSSWGTQALELELSSCGAQA